jgi:predicted nucleic acid-binding Zn ribbon protein
LVNSVRLKMAKKDPQIDRLGEVLDNSLKRFALSLRLDEYRVWPIWNDTVGATVARNAQPEKIRNGTLFVKVTSPVWMQQLQYMKEMIAEKLNQRLKSEVVRNIFFVVGKVDAEALEVKAQPVRRDPIRTQDGRPDEEFLNTVQDPEIRQAFKRLLKSYSRRVRKN